jgi:hypothetical protein
VLAGSFRKDFPRLFALGKTQREGNTFRELTAKLKRFAWNLSYLRYLYFRRGRKNCYRCFNPRFSLFGFFFGNFDKLGRSFL